MQRQLINRGKEAVYVQDHDQLKQLYAETHNRDYQVSVADIFLQLFYYACQHNRKKYHCIFISYEIFSDAERIGLRQSFYYGKFKIKKKSLVNWYNQCILHVIKVN